MPEPATVVTATGKRKSAVARVFLKFGSGNVLVNGKPVDEYFTREVSRILIRQPFEVFHDVLVLDFQRLNRRVATLLDEVAQGLGRGNGRHQRIDERAQQGAVRNHA